MFISMRFDTLNNNNTSINKCKSVYIHIQDVKTFDGDAYDTFEVDVIDHNGNLLHYEDVLDVMIE